MGGRGSFETVDEGKFNFTEGGQTFHSIGEVDGVKVLVRDKGAVKAPEYSHTAGRTYAIVQNGKLKHVTFYDENHKQSVSIDLMHSHYGLTPHKHFNLDHSDKGIPLSKKEVQLVNKIRRRFSLQWE